MQRFRKPMARSWTIRMLVVAVAVFAVSLGSAFITPILAQNNVAQPAQDLNQGAALPPCSAALTQMRQFQTPVPVTAPPPTATSANPPTTVAPQPTATLAPAPHEDHVGFPEGYQDNYKLMFVFDRPNNRQVRVICGNDAAVSAKEGQPFAYGSIVIMLTYRTKQQDGKVVTDDKGHYIAEALTGIFVQRKEKGFGVDYQGDRSGEWEYVAYRGDKSVLTAPEHTNACSSCHLRQGGDTVDYLFRLDRFYHPDQADKPVTPGQNEVVIATYAFYPAKLTVKVGTTVKWTNNDEANHTVAAADKSFTSDVLQSKDVKPGQTFSYTFKTAGTYDYSDPNSNMKATIVVEN